MNTSQRRLIRLAQLPYQCQQAAAEYHLLHQHQITSSNIILICQLGLTASTSDVPIIKF